MAKGDWPQSYVYPSLALSGSAAGFLIWHVIDPAAKVDGWTITLLVIGFLPWLKTVFESIDFPGGGSVTFRRKVEAEQERQAEEIQALRFLLARFLSKPERELLQQLARGETVRFDAGADSGRSLQYVDSLRRMGMVAVKAELLEAHKRLAERGHTSMDITTLGEIFEITDSGRQYLNLLDKLPAEGGPSYPDGSELRTAPSTPPL
jgi:hypothetical protein